ncbi:hypothetical protein JAAARDRAFT_143485, partial [Jaapia argillacea MUCL 33604]
HAQVYTHCQDAMVRLGASKAMLQKYRILDKSHCQVTTGIIDDHTKRGTRNTVLPWIWSMGDDNDVKGRHLTDFVRLHWLRAKAMRNHWQEELTLIMHEMTWASAYFAHRSREWDSRARDPSQSLSSGHKCYAMWQAEMWKMFATTAINEFTKILVLHPPLDIEEFEVNQPPERRHSLWDLEQE